MQELGARLALINACLNGCSAVLIPTAVFAVRRRRTELHGRLMLAAVCVSALFLVCYLTRVCLTGTHHYPGTGPWRTLYQAILYSHMILAAVTPVLVVRTVYLAV